MNSPTFILGQNNWAVSSSSILGYEYGDLSGQFSPIFLTSSRASTATYVDATGLIVTASNNISRIDYSTGTGSLLLEPQRTNLLLQSEDLTTANWSKSRVTITSNSIVAPDGKMTADTVTATTVTGQHNVQNGSHTSGSFIASIFAQKGTHNFFQIYSGVSSQAFANFNLNTGEIGTSGSLASGSIQNIGNGWYRCSTFITASAGSTIRWALVSSESASFAESWTTSGTESIYLWGGQLESGSYLTTYIPTTNSTVTRLTDTFNRTNMVTNGYIGPSGSTWYVELRNNVAYVRDTFNNTIWISDNSSGTSNAILIRNDSPSSSIRLRINKNVAGLQTNLFATATDTVKIAIKWNGTSADVFVNGTKQVSATAFTTTNMEFLAASGQQVPTFIQAMALYDYPLPDSELITLTTL